MTPRAWILAGGASRRFGSDKALADVDGAPMAVRVADTLRAAGFTPVLVARHARGLPLHEVLEPDVLVRHPLLGIACALEHVARDGEAGALVCAVDAWPLAAGQVAELYATRAVADASPLVGWWPARARGACLAGALQGLPVWQVARGLGLPERDVGALGNRNGR